MKECTKNKYGGGNPGNIGQSSSAAPPKLVASRGTTSVICGAAYRLYGITSRQEHDILDQGESLYFLLMLQMGLRFFLRNFVNISVFVDLL